MAQRYLEHDESASIIGQLAEEEGIPGLKLDLVTDFFRGNPRAKGALRSKRHSVQKLQGHRWNDGHELYYRELHEGYQRGFGPGSGLRVFWVFPTVKEVYRAWDPERRWLPCTTEEMFAWMRGEIN